MRDIMNFLKSIIRFFWVNLGSRVNDMVSGFIGFLINSLIKSKFCRNISVGQMSVRMLHKKINQYKLYIGFDYKSESDIKTLLISHFFCKSHMYH